MRLMLVVGARPNFMKIAPIVHALQARGCDTWSLVHTGQHYDPKMSEVFFQELKMPEPHHWLGVGSGTQAVQTAKIMTAFEDVCTKVRPDRVVVVGDVKARTFEEIMRAITRVSHAIPVIFPAHPRVAAKAAFLADGKSVRVLEPLGYLDFLALMKNAKLVLTDSGGLQEETTVLGIPCVTLRETTERPITITMGTNKLVGTRFDKIVAAAESALANPPQGAIPPLWDGHAAERIVDVLLPEGP